MAQAKTCHNFYCKISNYMLKLHCIDKNVRIIIRFYTTTMFFAKSLGFPKAMTIVYICANISTPTIMSSSLLPWANEARYFDEGESYEQYLFGLYFHQLLA